MKKFVLLIVTLLYAVVSSGITLNYHYCMGQLADVEMSDVTACASCGQKKQTSPCCSDTTQFIKLSVDQNVSQTSASVLSPAVIDLLPALSAEFNFQETAEATSVFVGYSDPPECSDEPLFIHHCTFLI